MEIIDISRNRMEIIFTNGSGNFILFLSFSYTGKDKTLPIINAPKANTNELLFNRNLFQSVALYINI